MSQAADSSFNEFKEEAKEILQQRMGELSPIELPEKQFADFSQQRQRLVGNALQHSEAKKTAKERKKEQAEKDFLNGFITRAEVNDIMNNFASQVNGFFTQQIVPMQQQCNISASLAEVIVESLLRKGLVTMDFLTQIQQELIAEAQKRQETGDKQDGTTEQRQDSDEGISEV